jgi:hypothetical protein
MIRKRGLLRSTATQLRLEKSSALRVPLSLFITILNVLKTILLEALSLEAPTKSLTVLIKPLFSLMVLLLSNEGMEVKKSTSRMERLFLLMMENSSGPRKLPREVLTEVMETSISIKLLMLTETGLPSTWEPLILFYSKGTQTLIKMGLVISLSCGLMKK